MDPSVFVLSDFYFFMESKREHKQERDAQRLQRDTK